MQVKNLETSLYHHLNHYLVIKNFYWIPESKQFRKQTERGFQNIILSCSSYADEMWVEVNMGVRVDLVEDFAQQFLDVPIEYRKHANTIITSIGRLSDTKYLRYKITHEEDVEVCYEAIKDFMQERGFEFLEYASHLKNLDKMLNEQPSKASNYLYNQTHRCFKAIIVAKLNNNPHFFELIDTYQQVLERLQVGEKEIDRYLKLVNFLLYLSLN
jgi:hypothetical protein